MLISSGLDTPDPCGKSCGKMGVLFHRVNIPIKVFHSRAIFFHRKRRLFHRKR